MNGHYIDDYRALVETGANGVEVRKVTIDNDECDFDQ